MGLLDKSFKKYIWLPLNCFFIRKKFSQFNVLDTLETLDYLQENRCSLIRFGDGELDLINETRDVGYQKRSIVLSRRMEEVLLTKQKDVLICLPSALLNYSHLGKYNERAQYHFRALLLRYHQYLLDKLPRNRLYGDGQITRPYMDTLDRNFSKKVFEGFKKIFNVKRLILVEGEKTRFGVGNDLFRNAQQVMRILAPAVNAFDKYDEILEKTLEVVSGVEKQGLEKKDVLFVLALGPCAKLLALELSKLGYRVLDVGHLDIEYEWFLRGATKKIPIPGKYVNEAKDGKVWSGNSNLDLEEYKKEIVARVGI